MATLVLGEHDNVRLDASTARAISAAMQLGEPVDLLIVGAHCRTIAEATSRLAGLRNVILVEDDALERPVAEQIAAILLDQATGYDAFVAAATAMGKSVMPRLAAHLDLAQVSEITRVVDSRTFEHPIYAGNAIETVRCPASKLVLTIRAAAFESVAEGGSATIVTVAVALPASRSRVVEEHFGVSERPDLTVANVVVSGGRAFSSKQAFDDLLIPLATCLGAAIGASRAAVDAGYAPNDLQVGQTGKIVRPDIYIAVGISGAVQHIAGMKDARIIIAINKDAGAPIFEIADYGVVGDLFEIVPELTRALA
jgi:electron transfer flavoprotein alpha subunit